MSKLTGAACNPCKFINMGREEAACIHKGTTEAPPSDAKTAKVRDSPYYHISVGEISVAQLTPLDLQTLLLLLADQR